MTTLPYTGAVCYIDLLGFSYLTTLLENNELYNDNEKEESFGDKKKPAVENTSEITIANWAYDIVDANLKRFHKIVKETCDEFQTAKYTVISDSLFIASEFPDDILFILANIFRKCIKAGILLRAGLAFGKYYSVETPISSFNIYGPAVTKAVSYEKLGKGCRIFTDSEFTKNTDIFSTDKTNIVSNYKNFQNYSTLDCFEWLMIKDKYVFDYHDIRSFPLTTNLQPALDLLCDNAEVLCNLLYSPKYEWNRKSAFGVEQLGASIEYISALIDKIYESCFPDEDEKLFLDEIKEGIEDGKFRAANQTRNEKELEYTINLKKTTLRGKFNL